MNPLRKKPLARRTVLKGMGVTLGLPLLDAMVPRLSYAAGGVDYLFFAFGFPLGIKALGDQENDRFSIGKNLRRLQPDLERRRLSVFHEIRQGGGSAHNMASILVANRTDEGNSRVVPHESFDVFLQNRLPRARTRKFQPLVMAIRNNGTRNPARECISWRGPGNFIPKEMNAQNLYSQVFSQPLDLSARRRLIHNLNIRKSALDLVKEELASFQKTLGAADKLRMQAYLDGIRNLENKIRSLENENPREPIRYTLPNMQAGGERQLAGFYTKAEAMVELALIAMATEQTQVATMTLEISGVDGHAYHDGDPGGGDLHHRMDREPGLFIQAKMHDLLARIFQYALKRSEDLDLYDRLALYMSTETGRHHVPVDGACIAAGGVWGPYLGRQQNAEQTSGSIFVYLAQRMGLEVERFGNSNGPLRL